MCSRPGELLRTRRKPPSWEHDGVFKSLVKESLTNPICNAMWDRGMAGFVIRIRSSLREIREPPRNQPVSLPQGRVFERRHLSSSIDIEKKASDAACVCAREVHPIDRCRFFEFCVMDVNHHGRHFDAAYSW